MSSVFYSIHGISFTKGSTLLTVPTLLMKGLPSNVSNSEASVRRRQARTACSCYGFLFDALFLKIPLCWEPTMTKAEMESLRNSVMALPEKDRAQLAKDLVASLDGPVDSEVARAWDIEICRRINEIESGKAVLLDADEVLARARARLGH
jgi:putative addiction module component (TIGR02574 family)